MFFNCAFFVCVNDAVFFQPKFPVSVYGLGFLLSFTGYIGVNLVLTLVRVAGAFAAVTVITVGFFIWMLLKKKVITSKLFLMNGTLFDI